ncbi:tetratricopeptide repeat protein [Micromonospora sediminicola]|uniref:tetratricopeptide repeat protein n=1 Tax=Micromonospora sediminicola TaxID=946078 RepID=UPI0033D83204
MGRRTWWSRWSVRARVGWVLVGWALGVVAAALPVWALATNDLTEVAGWANILALPVTTLGLALVLADRSRQALMANSPLVRNSASAAHVIGVLPEPADCLQVRGITGWDYAAVANQEAAVVILSGMGGVGKTQMAAAIARRMLAERRVDVLVWITAGSADAIVSAYAKAGADIIDVDPRDVQRTATMFVSWLATTPKRWLVVLDALDSPGDLDGWWPPRSDSGRVLVTTRRRDAALAGHGDMVTVGQFSPAEARDYLVAKFAGHPDRLVQAEDLAFDLGLLPLALAQAAAYIIDRDIDCAAYRRRLADQRRRLVELAPEPEALPDGHQATIATTWILSVDAADRLNPIGLARPLLVALSLLDGNGIPLDILATAATAKYLTRHRTAPATQPVAEEDATDAVGSLRRLSLATISADPSSASRIVRVHALLQRAVREQAPSELIEAAACAVADSLAGAWPDDRRARADDQVLRANTAALRHTAEEALWRDGVHPVLFRTGHSLGHSGLVNDAIAHFERLQADATHRLADDHPDTLKARSAAAHWRGEAGDAVGAAGRFKDLAADYVRAVGPDHLDTLRARRGLAFWSGESGQTTLAAKAFQQLVNDYRRLLGPDHPETLAARNGLSRWRGLAGDPAGAAASFRTLVEDCTRVLGPDHRETLAVRAAHAWWRCQAGEPLPATGLFRDLLADCIRVLGAHDPQTLRVRGSLAVCHGESGDAKAATALTDALLRDRLRLLGPDHPDTLITRTNLARWVAQTGDHATAEAQLRMLLADCIAILGPKHRRTNAVRTLLALSVKAQQPTS